jgi:UPF0042 nucleotide-binding protein
VLPGTDASIQGYVLESADARTYLAKIEDLLEFCIPRFENEGRTYLTVGVGCTGGRHRSVVFVEKLAASLRQKLGLSIDAVHRDLNRVNLSGPEGDPDHGMRSLPPGKEP